ncbi:hypothetical protein LTR36_004922 [Oleoguttula mirabilis]|uniref:Uncharacterized protein n=1 Tax=Oleoguttula mirabilis TaxID=1507867 RepID=A0AAV9JVJ2_9PEZI|nr:hypothetical protein LTR36_004922 [Oleoguttula mirabilis]
MSASHTPEPGTERTLRSSVRNPRRRQRQSDGDSLVATAPRRKRSKLGEDTFTPRANAEETDAGSAVMNGHPRGSTGGGVRKESTPMLDMELPVRGGKKTVKHRALKGDGATVLTQNQMYSVKLLPSTPRELRREGVEYRGVLGAGHHALAVTKTHAHVWDYSAHTTVSNARVFDLPFPAREGEALPFGALVISGASTDIGLLLLSATTGKIVFYESIDRAASLGLFQERNSGVEGTISGFSSGENVIDIVSADHAGFILTLSSGRIVQLTLRDAQGKARIFTQPLRPGDAGSGGIFGSIKGLWSGAWKKGVTAVRTRALDQRGQMQAIALTERCELQIWDLDWSGRHEYRSSMDFREVMVQELKSLESAEMQGCAESITALDFVIVDKPASVRGHEVATLGAEQPLSIWLLFKMGYTDAQDYVLAELSLAGDMVNIERTLKLESYHGGAITQKPSLLLPKPGHTALVIFDDALVLVATTEAGTSDDPNAQLHDASYIEPHSFEDAVYLRSGRDLALLGACVEDTRSAHASSIAFIKGAGLVRLSATDPSGDVERSRIPAKSKIEQAIFYGAMQDNILDFGQKGDYSYAAEEVEEAALNISDEILRSDTSFISTKITSIEAHLDYRARALGALVTHVRQNYPALSRSAMWQLLWDAEKVAAAQQMWKAFEEHKGAVSKVKRKATVLDELCGQLEEHHGLETLDETREDDLVRRFFVKGLSRIDYVLSHIRGLLEQLQQNQTETPEKIVRYVAEADDLWSKALDTAITFRTENAAAYNIAPELSQDGVLGDAADYSDLPEFWTSSRDMLKASRHIATLSREFAKHYFEQEDAHNFAQHINQITVCNPGLIQLCCLIYKERINWLSARADQKDQSEARTLRTNFEAERYDQFRALAGIGRANEGMQLAERYWDMQTLTELVVGESQYYVDELANSNLQEEQRTICVDLLRGITDRISKYFGKFGDDWANAFFDEAFSGSRAGLMLDEAQTHWKEPLTRYLRAEPARAKICWVNDVSAAKDFAHAGVVLAEAAAEQETRLWARKVELSMSKLALMAAQEGSRQPAADARAVAARPERELKLVGVQEKLYRHLRSEVMGALDREAEMEIAMQRFGLKSKKSAALQQLLETEIERVLDSQALSIEELVDVLTLMDSSVYSTEAETPSMNIDGSEFLLALQALDAVAPIMEQRRFETLLQLIWKRCYVHDDWVSLMTTQAKKVRPDADVKSLLIQTAPWRTFYALHKSQPSLLSDDSNIRVLSPAECLGAACKPADLAYRFSEADLLDPILHDNKIQDELLAGFVADRKLNEWMRDCEDDAKRSVAEYLDDTANLREKERELEDSEEKREEWQPGKRNGKANGNGHLNGVNGVAQDEDVAMA